MKTIILKSVAVILAVSSLVACGKKSDDGGSVSAGRDVRLSAGPSNLPTGNGQLVGQSGAFVLSQNQAQLEEAVKALVSPTVDPKTVGTVSPQNGIEIRGQVTVDRNTGAVLNTSKVQLTIKDSNVGQTLAGGETIQPILIVVAGAAGGAANYNANLTFTDEYGTITVTGTYNTSNFSGTVSFANSKGPGFNGKNAGTLGTFNIPTCAFFVCQ